MTNEIPQGIKGITDRPLRPPRIGKVRLGVMVPSDKPRGKSRPKATEYFVFDEDDRDAARAAFDEQPTEIPIIIPSNSLAAVAANNFKLYGSRGLKCVGNGDSARALVKLSEYGKWNKTRAAPDTGELRRELPPKEVWIAGKDDSKTDRKIIPCFGMGSDDEPACPMFELAQGCRPLMHFQFMIPAMPGFGVWQLDTSSEISITSVLGFLTYLQEATGGQIAGIPLEMRLVPKDVQPDGKKKTVYVLELAYTGSMVELAGLRTRNLSDAILPAPAEADRHLLPEGEDEVHPEDLERPDPTVQADEEQEQATARTIGIPAEEFADAPAFSRWCFETLELQPAQIFERYGVSNYSELIEQFDGSLLAVAADLAGAVQGERIMERMTDGIPPLGDDGPAFSDDGAEQVELVRGS